MPQNDPGTPPLMKVGSYSKYRQQQAPAAQPNQPLRFDMPQLIMPTTENPRPSASMCRSDPAPAPLFTPQVSNGRSSGGFSTLAGQQQMYPLMVWGNSGMQMMNAATPASNQGDMQQSVQKLMAKLQHENDALKKLEGEERELDERDSLVKMKLAEVHAANKTLDQKMIDIQRGWRDLYHREQTEELPTIPNTDAQERELQHRVDAIRQKHDSLQHKLKLIKEHLHPEVVAQRRQKQEERVAQLLDLNRQVEHQRRTTMARTDAIFDTECARESQCKRYIAEEETAQEDDDEVHTHYLHDVARHSAALTRGNDDTRTAAGVSWMMGTSASLMSSGDDDNDGLIFIDNEPSVAFTCSAMPDGQPLKKIRTETTFSDPTVGSVAM